VCLIQDRESDIFEFMNHPRAANVDILLRATQPRKVEVNVASDLKQPISLGDSRVEPANIENRA
jgi:hypothetical protein